MLGGLPVVDLYCSTFEASRQISLMSLYFAPDLLSPMLNGLRAQPSIAALRSATVNPELLEALKGEATVIDGKLCWCGMPNMIPYRGHDSGCEYNRELVAKAEGFES